MGGKEFVGRVVSNRMQKTVVVAIDHMHWIPKLKGYKKSTSKLKAHDEQQECNIGDTVRIHWCKRISKHKHYSVMEVLKRVPQFDIARAKELADAAEAGQYSSRIEHEQARVDAARARLEALKEMYKQELGVHLLGSVPEAPSAAPSAAAATSTAGAAAADAAVSMQQHGVTG